MSLKMGNWVTYECMFMYMDIQSLYIGIVIINTLGLWAWAHVGLWQCLSHTNTAFL